MRQADLQTHQGPLQMVWSGLPTRRTRKHFRRQRVSKPQKRDEIQCFGYQPEHLPVRRFVRDAELPLDGPQRHHSIPLSQPHNDDRRRIGVGAAEYRILEHRKHAMPQLAMGRFLIERLAHARQWSMKR